MSDNFDLYSKYYDLLYGDKEYNSEVEYIIKCIKKHAPNSNTILEFGSGTGKHGLLLEKQGYTVYGLEKSPSMVAVAKRNGFNCKQSDITNFAIADKFDVVLSLFHVISYITDNKSLNLVFQNAYNSLNDGGLFIFDVWYSPAVYTQVPERRIKKVENDNISVIRFAEPKMNFNNNVVEVHYTILVKEKESDTWIQVEETHPMRHFTIPEIETLANINGFKLIKSESFLTGIEPSNYTWGINFILKKF
jgi:SAM-dependent methyltransferase